MPRIDLLSQYDYVSVDNDKTIQSVINDEIPLSDIEIGFLLDEPLGSPQLEDVIEAGKSVLFVVPGASRRSAAGQIINLVVRRLIANGIQPGDMAVIFANGENGPVSEIEKKEILTPFIAQRLNTFQHDPKDKLQLFHMGETSGGVRVSLNWKLTEYDRIITIGDVRFDHLAGFTGGRDLICPGLASAETIQAIKSTATVYEESGNVFKKGVGPGLLNGNPVHELMTECSAFVPASFAFHTIVNESGEAIDLICGEPITSFVAACERYLSPHKK